MMIVVKAEDDLFLASWGVSEKRHGSERLGEKPRVQDHSGSRSCSLRTAGRGPLFRTWFWGGPGGNESLGVIEGPKRCRIGGAS